MAAVTICSDFGAQKNKERLNQTKFARLIWSLHFQCYKIAWDLLACAECKHHPRPHHAAAKSLQSCPTLCDPIDGSPPGFPIPGILQAGTLEWVAISFSNVWKWKVKSEVAQPCPALSDPMDCSLPGSSIRGIFQARVLEWGAIAFDWTELNWYTH